jgi:hypothetical protein
MGDKYRNEEGVYIDVDTDKRGKDHISFYDSDPREEDHKSIHINYDSDSGKGQIVDTTSGEKETTDTSCFLTSACMKFFQDKFDDNCYELRVLRWFRDSFVSNLEIGHYYQVAPSIVEGINNDNNSNIIYDYIYDNVVIPCVDAIENGNYEFAYNRYKNSVLAFEETFAKKEFVKRLVKSLGLIKV